MGHPSHCKEIRPVQAAVVMVTKLLSSAELKDQRQVDLQVTATFLRAHFSKDGNRLVSAVE